jgi:hypothetical protein
MAFVCYDFFMQSNVPMAVRSSCSPRLAGFVMVLCICVVMQMLGMPATFVDLMSSDALVKLEPVSEDHSAVSPLPEAGRPGFLTGFTEYRAVLHLPVLTTSVFHPPSA